MRERSKRHGSRETPNLSGSRAGLDDGRRAAPFQAQTHPTPFADLLTGFKPFARVGMSSQSYD